MQNSIRASCRTSLATDEWYLFVQRPSQAKDFWSDATRVFTPLTPSMWLVLVLSTCFMALAECFLFRREMREDLVNRWHAAQERGERLDRAKILGGQFSHRCLMSALQWTAGFQEEPPAISHSIAWLGWSFLILIIVAA